MPFGLGFLLSCVCLSSVIWLLMLILFYAMRVLNFKKIWTITLMQGGHQIERRETDYYQLINIHVDRQQTSHTELVIAVESAATWITNHHCSLSTSCCWTLLIDGWLVSDSLTVSIRHSLDQLLASITRTDVRKTRDRVKQQERQTKILTVTHLTFSLIPCVCRLSTF